MRASGTTAWSSLRGVALGGSHAEHVPVVEGRHSAVVAGEEAVHEPRTVLGSGALGLLAEHGEARPGGGERGEDLRAGEGVPAVDPLGGRERVPQHQVVAGLAEAEGEQLAGLRIREHPVEARVAALVQHPRDAGHHEVHVDRERGRRGVGAEQALVADDLEQRARREVSGGAQLVEILGEEDVVAVVAGRPRADAVEQFRASGRTRAPG